MVALLLILLVVNWLKPESSIVVTCSSRDFTFLPPIIMAAIFLPLRVAVAIKL